MKAIFPPLCCLAILLLSAVGTAAVDMPLLGIGFAAGAADDVPGVPVQRVVAQGPAGKTGIAPDDVVLSISGQPVDAYAEITRFLRDKKPGSEVVLRVRRGAETFESTVTLGSMRALGFRPAEIWMAYWATEDLSEAEQAELMKLRNQFGRFLHNPVTAGHFEHHREGIAITREIDAFQEEVRILDGESDDIDFELETLNSEGKGLNTEQSREWQKRYAKLMARGAPLEERWQDYHERKRDHDNRFRLHLDKSPQLDPPYEAWKNAYIEIFARYTAFSEKMFARSSGDEVE